MEINIIQSHSDLCSPLSPLANACTHHHTHMAPISHPITRSGLLVPAGHFTCQVARPNAKAADASRLCVTPPTPPSNTHIHSVVTVAKNEERGDLSSKQSRISSVRQLHYMACGRLHAYEEAGGGGRRREEAEGGGRRREETAGDGRRREEAAGGGRRLEVESDGRRLGRCVCAPCAAFYAVWRVGSEADQFLRPQSCRNQSN